MKKIVAFIIICIMIFATAGCMKDNTVENDTNENSVTILSETINNEPAQEPADETTPDSENESEESLKTPKINTDEYKVSYIYSEYPAVIKDFNKSERTSAVSCEMFNTPNYVFNSDYFEYEHPGLYDDIYNIALRIYVDNYFDWFGKYCEFDYYDYYYAYYDDLNDDEITFFNEIIKKYFPNATVVRDVSDRLGVNISGISETEVTLYQLLDMYFNDYKSDILENRPQIKTIVKFSITNDYKNNFYAKYIGYNEVTNVVETVHEFILNEEVYNTYFAELDKEING